VGIHAPSLLHGWAKVDGPVTLIHRNGPIGFLDSVKGYKPMRLVWIILAFLMPPLAVFLKRGPSLAFLLNILLTILIYVPGLIHALLIVTKDKD
jgi:uncharacterized membrane protein YqaE (UPF0057 family)